MIAFLRKLGHAVVRDAIDDVGAMMAYYAILSAFPMLFFVVTLAALVLPSDTIAEGTRLALETVPSTARSLVAAQVDSVTHVHAGFVFGTVVFAVWGASRGASGLMLALNRLFGRVETRSWLHRRAIAVALTVGLAVLLVIALGLLVGGPIIGRVVANRFGLGGVFDIAWTVGRWMAAGLLVMVVWALAYRFLPDTDAPFRIFTPGAVVSVGLWLGISRLFALYLDHVGSYTSIYGALVVVVIVLTWLWLSSMSLLFGAEINETRRDPESARRQRERRSGKQPPDQQLDEWVGGGTGSARQPDAATSGTTRARRRPGARARPERSEYRRIGLPGACPDVTGLPHGSGSPRPFRCRRRRGSS